MAVAELEEVVVHEAVASAVVAVVSAVVFLEGEEDLAAEDLAEAHDQVLAHHSVVSLAGQGQAKVILEGGLARPLVPAREGSERLAEQESIVDQEESGVQVWGNRQPGNVRLQVPLDKGAQEA